MHRYLQSISFPVHSAGFLRRYNEKKFVRRLCAGKSSAWIQLVERWSPHLYTYIFYNVEHEEETRKLMHLVLSEVIHTVIETPRISSLTVIIYSIAYRQILQYHSQQAASHSAKGSVTSQSSQVQMSNSSNRRKKFMQQLQHFSPQTQQLLLLRYVCGVNLTELSKIVGQSEDVLVQLLRRAKAQLY